MTEMKHAEHLTPPETWPSDCLEGDCEHRDEDGEPEGMDLCPSEPFEVCVDCTESLIPAAIQSPEDEIVTHVVAHDADGDLYVIDGVIDVSVLVRAVVDEVWPDVMPSMRDVGGQP